MISLALSTFTMPSWWADEDERTIITALQMIDDLRDAQKGGSSG